LIYRQGLRQRTCLTHGWHHLLQPVRRVVTFTRGENHTRTPRVLEEPFSRPGCSVLFSRQDGLVRLPAHRTAPGPTVHGTRRRGVRQRRHADVDTLWTRESDTVVPRSRERGPASIPACTVCTAHGRLILRQRCLPPNDPHDVGSPDRAAHRGARASAADATGPPDGDACCWFRSIAGAGSTGSAAYVPPSSCRSVSSGRWHPPAGHRRRCGRRAGR
jgi:hypothetical protein